MSNILKTITGSNFKNYIDSSNFCTFRSSVCIIGGKFGKLSFNFTNEDATECQLRIRRVSGNGLFVISSGNESSNHNVISKVFETITVNLSKDKLLSLVRPHSGVGNIELISITLISQAEKNGGLDLRAELNKCRRKSIRLVGDRVFANEGSSLAAGSLYVETIPPNMFKKEGSEIKFLGLCEIVGLRVNVPSPHEFPKFLEPVRKASDFVTTIPKVVDAKILPSDKVVPGNIAAPLPSFAKQGVIVSNDNWKLSSIPKIAHFYWGGKMSFLRYVSIYSFVRMNPDWKVKLHVPEVLGNIKPTWSTGEQKGGEKIQSNTKDYIGEVKKLDIEVVSHNFDKYSFPNSAHEVHKSDILRWILLSTEGGVWSDSDIIYHQPMFFMPDNTDANASKDTGVCMYGSDSKWSNGSHAIGFLMSSPDNVYYRNLHQMSKRLFNKKKYQAIGADLLNRKFATLKKSAPKCDFLKIQPDTVYSVTNIPHFLSEKIYIQDYPRAIGFHWYGGAANISKFESSVNEKNYHEYDNFLGKLIQVTLR